MANNPRFTGMWRFMVVWSRFGYDHLLISRKIQKGKPGPTPLLPLIFSHVPAPFSLQAKIHPVFFPSAGKQGFAVIQPHYELLVLSMWLCTVSIIASRLGFARCEVKTKNKDDKFWFLGSRPTESCPSRSRRLKRWFKVDPSKKPAA